VLELLRKALTRQKVIVVTGRDRRTRVVEEVPSNRFVVIVALMIVFFIGLIAMQIVHLIILGSWSSEVFNGIMLIVGTIVGAIWGRNEA